MNAETSISDASGITPPATTTVLHPGGMTRALRFLGAATLIAAGASFLVSNWMDASPLMRSYGFLGFAAFLAAAGIYCGVRWREDKGARTFLALSALATVACFAQLGALVHAHLGDPRVLPLWQPVRPQQVDPSQLLLLAAVTLVVLVPVCLLAFKALARPQGLRLTFVHLVGCAAVLLPARDPNTIAALTTGLFAFLLHMDRRHFAKTPLMKHWDGVAVRLSLALPPIVVLARTLLFYGTTPALSAVVLGIAGTAFFLGLTRFSSDALLNGTFRVLGIALYGAGWIVLAGPLADMTALPPSERIIPVVLLPLCGMLFALSFSAGSFGVALRELGGISAALLMLLQLGIFGGALSTIGSLVLAIALVVGAFRLALRSYLVMGAGLFGFTLLHMAIGARELWAQNLWVSLGALGVVTLLLSSILERNWSRIHQGRTALANEWRSWN